MRPGRTGLEWKLTGSAAEAWKDWPGVETNSTGSAAEAWKDWPGVETNWICC